MSGTFTHGRGTPRRTVVAAAGAVGFTAALTACGSDSSGDGSDPQDQETPDAAQSTAEEPAESPAEEEQDSGGGLAKTSDIPEGGGKIFKDEKVVVTQPAAGEFKAFSAVCTHQGCIVSSVGDGTINCACHGSQYSMEDGSVKKGPATQPLAAAEVSVEGEDLKLG